MKYELIFIVISLINCQREIPAENNYEGKTKYHLTSWCAIYNKELTLTLKMTL